MPDTSNDNLIVMHVLKLRKEYYLNFVRRRDSLAFFKKTRQESKAENFGTHSEMQNINA